MSAKTGVTGAANVNKNRCNWSSKCQQKQMKLAKKMSTKKNVSLAQQISTETGVTGVANVNKITITIGYAQVVFARIRLDRIAHRM
jgi:hypothetical protein